ncbi:MAG: hypothetical protein WCO89_05690, partial [Syntrophus sp. (in: bacteria)]
VPSRTKYKPPPQAVVIDWCDFLDTMDLIEMIKPIAIRPDHPYLVNVQKYNLSSDEKGSLETMHRIVREGP